MFLVRLDSMHCQLRYISFLPVELALAYRDWDVNVTPQMNGGRPREVPFSVVAMKLASSRLLIEPCRLEDCFLAGLPRAFARGLRLVWASAAR